MKLRSGKVEKSVPNDILEEILFRLPVKSVLRFRCVSRAWRSLISSHHFSKLYLTCCPKESLLKCTRVAFVRNNNFHFCSLDSLLHDPMVDVSDGSCFHGDKTKFVGSCDGLICLSNSRNEQDIILWNPSTKEYFELPKMPSDFGGENMSDDHCVFGFGKTRDGEYKVVSLHRKEKHGYNEVIVSIYCLSTGEWRKLNKSYDFGSWGYLLRTGAKFLDGKIHWFATRRRDWGISTFNLEMEECGRIQMPTEFDPQRYVFELKLEVCEGCIYIFIGEYYHVDVWSLNGYDGEEPCWTHAYEIRSDGKPYSSLCDRIHCQVVKENDEILFGRWFGFRIFNKNDHVLRFPKFRKWQEKNVSIEAAICYIPSLLSPSPIRRGTK